MRTEQSKCDLTRRKGFTFDSSGMKSLDKTVFTPWFKLIKHETLKQKCVHLETIPKIQNIATCNTNYF